MVIYITTNLVNKNKYIGRDSNNNPHYYGSGSAIKHAFKKYGKSNFKKEILEYCNSIEELCLKELFWIDHFNAVESKNFYNINRNTYGSTKFNKPSKEDKSKKLKEHWKNLSLDKRTEFSRTMSIAQSKHLKKHTPESKKKMVENRKTFKTNHRVSKGIRFQSEETKLLRSKVMKEKSKIYAKEFTIAIDQFTLDMTYVKTWESITEINQILKLDMGSISNCINNKRQKTVGGFIWKKH